MSGGCGSLAGRALLERETTSDSSGDAIGSAAAGALMQLAFHGNFGKLPQKLQGAPTAAIAEAFARDGKIALRASGAPMTRGELVAFIVLAESHMPRATCVDRCQHVIDQLDPYLADINATALSRAHCRITKARKYVQYVKAWKLGRDASLFSAWLKCPWQLGNDDTDGSGSSASASMAAPAPAVGASSSASRTSSNVRSGTQAAQAAILSADFASDSGDRIAAMQAGWTQQQWNEAEEEVGRSTSSSNRGSIVLQLSDKCARDMREFALRWIEYVDKPDLGRDHFGRDINNAEEIFLFPVGPEHEKADIRETATLFVDGYKNRAMPFEPQVGLTPVARLANADFMRELEVKVQIALRQYGEKVRQDGYRRMVLHSMSLIRFSSGRPPQHEHFDLLGTNCWAFIVNLSECTCGAQCQFEGTRLFSERNGQGAPQLNPACDEYTKTIFDGLCNGIPMHRLCEQLPPGVAQSARESFDAFGTCVTAEQVRNAFAPVSANARLGEVWGTNGMHGAPGNRIQTCDRLVLFLAAAPEGQPMYDGGTQTNGALIMGIYHGLFSLEYLQYIVETELVDGMPVTGHMFSDMNVTGSELVKMGVKTDAFGDAVKLSEYVQQGDYWSEIVLLVHNTVYGGNAAPPVYRGQLDANGKRRMEGECRAKVRQICAAVYTVLQCAQPSARTVLVQAIETQFRTQGDRRQASTKRAKTSWLATLENLAKVWQKARQNHDTAVGKWLRSAQDSAAQSASHGSRSRA